MNLISLCQLKSCRPAILSCDSYYSPSIRTRKVSIFVCFFWLFRSWLCDFVVCCLMFEIKPDRLKIPSFSKCTDFDFYPVIREWEIGKVVSHLLSFMNNWYFHEKKWTLWWSLTGEVLREWIMDFHAKMNAFLRENWNFIQFIIRSVWICLKLRSFPWIQPMKLWSVGNSRLIFFNELLFTLFFNYLFVMIPSNFIIDLLSSSCYFII